MSRYLKSVVHKNGGTLTPLAKLALTAPELAFVMRKSREDVKLRSESEVQSVACVLTLLSGLRPGAFQSEQKFLVVWRSTLANRR